MLLPILRQIEQKALVERSARGLRAAVGNPHGNRHHSRHRLNQRFIEALLLDFDAHGRKAIGNAVFAEGGSGPPEKVFNEFWKPSRGRLGPRRGRKLLDDHKAVDFSLQVGF